MRRTSAAVALLVLCLTGMAGATMAPDLAEIGIGAAQRVGAARVYRLRIHRDDRPVLLLVPTDARLATLEVDGVVLERAGSEVPVGSAPLGHDSAAFTLANLRPQDRVLVRVWGSTSPLELVYASDVVRQAWSVGFASGAFYAVLATLTLVLIFAFCSLRDPTIAWYCGFTLSLIALELARDGLFDASPAFEFIAHSFLIVFIVGYVASYLRLRTQAPGLLRAAILWNLAPTVILCAVTLWSHRSVDIVLWASSDFTGMAALVAIAALRRHRGYLPAAYLAVGLLGLPLMLAIAIVEVATGTFSPFVQHWGLEIGGSFDTVGFSLALVLRARYHLRERTQIERELAAAAFAAGHDELTGLLNRRGLDAHLGNLAASESTVLFGDLDGFKLVNDMSGHAAGDDILRSVAGVLQRAVRAGDIIARIGGDEFVVVLAGSTDRTAATQTMARIAQSVSVLPLLKRSDTVQFGMSIGMGSQGPGKSFDAAIAEADADAYRVKSEHYAAARERARNLQA